MFVLIIIYANTRDVQLFPVVLNAYLFAEKTKINLFTNVFVLENPELAWWSSISIRQCLPSSTHSRDRFPNNA